jgi:SAM-dependent methyltransferase
MPYLPDVNDPRYLEEVGWFLYHEKHGQITLGDNFDEERAQFSRWFLEEVLALCGRQPEWLADKTVVSIGCGCTGDLATWPAGVKIGLDPLVYAYQKLGMLVEDAPGTSRTVYLAIGAEDLPLLDESADVVVCRNALDHMVDPDPPVKEMSRILRTDGLLFLGVDIGGEPTPDEPTIFTPETLTELVGRHFEILTLVDRPRPYSENRPYSVRILARRKAPSDPPLDKERLLRAYMSGWSGSKWKAHEARLED